MLRPISVTFSVQCRVPEVSPALCRSPTADDSFFLSSHPASPLPRFCSGRSKRPKSHRQLLHTLVCVHSFTSQSSLHLSNQARSRLATILDLEGTTNTNGRAPQSGSCETLDIHSLTELRWSPAQIYWIRIPPRARIHDSFMSRTLAVRSTAPISGIIETTLSIPPSHSRIV